MNPSHREEIELPDDASEKVTTCLSPSPAPKELGFFTRRNYRHSDR
jgi:hypothetical protein